jgi:hypothetical protein
MRSRPAAQAAQPTSNLGHDGLDVVGAQSDLQAGGAEHDETFGATGPVW